MKSDYSGNKHSSSRRAFLRHGFAIAVGAPLGWRLASQPLWAVEETQAIKSGPSPRSDSKVAIVACKGYGPEVRAALAQGFDLLGGIGSLVKNKTVTVKVNLTGTDFTAFLDRPVGETYMTHFSTVQALGSLLFAAGARRNLGTGKNYSHVTVPGGGYMFSALDLNHSYRDTDVMVSLAKLKNHITAGVTLSMKNMFGATPNSLYGSQAGTEDALEGRGVLHNPMGSEQIKLPGLKSGITATDPTWRVPESVLEVREKFSRPAGSSCDYRRDHLDERRRRPVVSRGGPFKIHHAGGADCRSEPGVDGCSWDGSNGL